MPTLDFIMDIVFGKAAKSWQKEGDKKIEAEINILCNSKHFIVTLFLLSGCSLGWSALIDFTDIDR